MPLNAILFFLHEHWQFLPQTCTHSFAESTQIVSSWASLPPTRIFSFVLTVAVHVWPQSIFAHTIAAPAPLGLLACRLGRSLRLSSCFWSLCRQLKACDFRVKLKFFFAFTRFANCRHSIPQDALIHEGPSKNDKGPDQHDAF